jgi:hypothetical protein
MLCQKQGVQTGHCGARSGYVRLSSFDRQVRAVAEFKLIPKVGKEVTLAIIYLKYSED